MFLVVIHWFWNNSYQPLILTKTKDKAEEFIKDYDKNRQLDDCIEYRIEEINIYE